MPDKVLVVSDGGPLSGATLLRALAGGTGVEALTWHRGLVDEVARELASTRSVDDLNEWGPARLLRRLGRRRLADALRGRRLRRWLRPYDRVLVLDELSERTAAYLPAGTPVRRWAGEALAVPLLERPGRRAQIGIGDDALVVGTFQPPTWGGGADHVLQLVARLDREREAHGIWIGHELAGAECDAARHDRSHLGLTERAHMLGRSWPLLDQMAVVDVVVALGRTDELASLALVEVPGGRPILRWDTPELSEALALGGAAVGRSVRYGDHQALAAAVLAEADGTVAVPDGLVVVSIDEFLA